MHRVTGRLLQRGRRKALGGMPEPEISAQAPWLSIVIPMKNEAGNVALMTGAVARACAGRGRWR